MTTPKDVATWMADLLRKEGVLYQEDAVDQIERRFGAEFVYANDNGNPAISPKVLKAFGVETETWAVWERGERMWRLRESHDTPGKRQAD